MNMFHIVCNVFMATCVFGSVSRYSTIQCNFIAKCQYICTRNVCGAKYTHHTFTPFIKKKKSLNYNNSK